MIHLCHQVRRSAFSLSLLQPTLQQTPKLYQQGWVLPTTSSASASRSTSSSSSSATASSTPPGSTPPAPHTHLAQAEAAAAAGVANIDIAQELLGRLKDPSLLHTAGYIDGQWLGARSGLTYLVGVCPFLASKYLALGYVILGCVPELRLAHCMLATVLCI